MNKPIDEELFSQVEEHLKCNEQNWLLGAGTSYDANLPLMYPLTNKVKKDLKNNNNRLFDEIITPLFSELPTDCHIEHVLSHLGDYAALAERSREKKTIINGNEIELASLEAAHNSILESIANTIRCGYKEDNEGNTVDEGSLTNPIVDIDAHLDFINTLFNHASAGVHERRKTINIFTTNYDTLLEDALALNKIPYWDGFAGGAVAYRTQRYGDPAPLNGQRANLIKMHGSIDWFLCEKG
ncbi:SIR2 family protein [Salinicola sp. NYA28a]